MAHSTTKTVWEAVLTRMFCDNFTSAKIKVYWQRHLQAEIKVWVTPTIKYSVNRPTWCFEINKTLLLG